MNVLALLTESFGGRGGIAQYNRDLLKALSADPAIVRILILERNPAGCSPDVPPVVQLLPSGRNKVSFALAAIAAAVSRRPIDVVFCGHINLVPLARLISALCGARLWLQLHGIEAWSPPAGLVRRSVGTACLVTAVSRYTRRRFLQWADCAPSRARVLPNTVDWRFRPGPRDETLAERWGLRGRKVLLTVSRLRAGEAYKGHERVIRALPELLREHPALLYVIAGDGPRANELRELAHRESVQAALCILGRVEDNLLPELYRLADVFVMASTGEGFGIVFLEAAACGVPVVGGALDGSRDALADGEIGRLVDPDDLPGLISAVKGCLAEPRRRGDAVERFAFDRFSVHARSMLGEFALSENREPGRRGAQVEAL